MCITINKIKNNLINLNLTFSSKERSPKSRTLIVNTTPISQSLLSYWLRYPLKRNHRNVNHHRGKWAAASSANILILSMLVFCFWQIRCLLIEVSICSDKAR